MKILAVDTTARAASVCISEKNKVIGSFFVDTSLTHSRTLMPMIDALLSSTETDVKELNAIAVNAGPGSFTGVRIGVAAVKGLAFARNIPCVAVSTLESMAYNCLGRDCVVCAVMDARCSQVYNALFRVQGETIERLCEDRAMSLADLKQEIIRLAGKTILVGDGAELSYAYLKEEIPHVVLAPVTCRMQTAVSTALAAPEYINRGETLTAEELVPVYLRLPQAQRELNQRLNNKVNRTGGNT